MLLDLLFPRRCVFCRRLVSKGLNLCGICAETLPFCQGTDARQSGEFYSSCISPLYYTDTVRDSHHRYKFQGARWYANTYAPFVAQCITEHYAGRYDLITWVPLSRKRRRKRGYDQAELLAVAVSAELGIPNGRAGRSPLQATLCKTRDTAPLSSLGGKDERKAQISEAYAVLDSAAIAEKRILLIDDVVTTGASLAECARTLLMAGADEVLCATLARSEV